MCLGVPGQITSIFEADGLRMGYADFGGVARSVCLAYTPQAAVGDYILVHVGFALSVISQEEAQETLRLLDEVNGVGP